MRTAQTDCGKAGSKCYPTVTHTFDYRPDPSPGLASFYCVIYVIRRDMISLPSLRRDMISLPSLCYTHGLWYTMWQNKLPTLLTRRIVYCLVDKSAHKFTPHFAPCITSRPSCLFTQGSVQHNILYELFG